MCGAVRDALLIFDRKLYKMKDSFVPFRDNVCFEVKRKNLKINLEVFGSVTKFMVAVP